MNTKLIWITPETEKLIAYIARVSNPNNQENPEYSKLIKYCIDHQHWSVFETANACFEIKTSRAITAQILRHRSFTFQEFSTRYAKVSSFEDINVRRQDNKNRQASHDDLDPKIVEWFTKEYQAIKDKVFSVYEKALELGIAKECARSILPLSTSSTIYMNGTIRSWIHWIELRTEEGTQKEHRDIAESIKQTLTTELPTIAEALEWT